MPRAIKNQDIVNDFMKHERFVDDILYCKSWGSFLIYDGGYYRCLDVIDMKEYIRDLMLSERLDVNITMALIKDISAQLELATKNKVSDIDTPYIALKDGLLNMTTFEFADFDRKHMAIHKVNISKEDLSKPCPNWQKFLDTSLVHPRTKEPDEDMQTLVQEMFGFYLLTDIRPHCCFFLVGGGRNGKSVLIHVLQKIIGDRYTSAMSIETLTTNNFAAAGLIGKKLNVCNEEESKYLRSDKFKALVSGDMIQGERKFQDLFVFTPKAKYIFATNEMPTFDGLNDGLKERINIIPFFRKFEVEEQDHALKEKLIDEIGGILNWAIAGAMRLVEQNYKFTFSKNAINAKKEFEDNQSGSLKFLHERFEVINDKKGAEGIAREALYDEYVQWTKATGKKNVQATNFYKDLRDHGKVKEHILKIEGASRRAYYLRRLRPDEYVENFEVKSVGALDEERDALPDFRDTGEVITIPDMRTEENDYPPKLL